MGLFVKHAVQFNSGWYAETSSGILAGMVVAIEANGTTGEIQLARADRSAAGHAAAAIAGLAGDDATSTGNTQVIVDPVYQTVMSKPARRIGDYKDETITNTTNWTDTNSAKRGVTVFSVGGEFASDQFSATTVANGANTDAAGTPAFAINDGWSYAVTANAGKLVDDGAQAITILARLTGSVADGLLPFRWIFAGA